MKTMRVCVAARNLSVSLVLLVLSLCAIACGGGYSNSGGGGGGGGTAPYITTQPADQTVAVGQAATFSVVASGTAPLNYQWQKNGADISGATSSSYTTPATTTSDNGDTFKVVVSNSAGSATSSAATLTVNGVGNTATWTYVQESVITYCANNTSSCSNFGGTMIPTRSDTVWIFGISTVNDVTATVSGGGAMWTECASCTTFLSGFRRNRVFYAIGGTANSTNFSISLSGNSGSSFAVTFVEVLPPAGSTAQFDTGGATSSSTCSGTCTGVSLSGINGGDVIVQFMNRTAPADYKSWPSPYLSLPNGDGIHLNAPAGNEAAPVVNTTGSPGAVFSAIAFTSSAGNFTPPAAGSMSLVQFADPDPANGLTGLSCSPTCSLTVTSTGAGHLLYLEAANVSGTFISSTTTPSGGGTWVVPTGANGCRINGGQSSNNTLSCAYVLASTSSATSIFVTMTGNGTTQFAFYEIATSTGQFAFETAGTKTNSASHNPSGVSLSLAAGVNYAVFQSISVFGGTSSLSYYPYLRGCRSGCGPQFYNGQAASDAFLNATSSTSVPQFSNQQNNATVVSAVAFRTQ